MQTRFDEGKLTIFLEGRIDSNNAAQTERELFEAVEGKDAAPVLDAEKLEYISSAGLRVLMKLRKHFNTPITMENVSREVYDILDTTGFTQLLNVKKAFRRISIDGLEPLGMGATAKVYRLDPETIVKVFNPNVSFDMMIGREIGKARSAFVSGVPTAIPFDVVRVGDSYGTVYELLDAEDLSGLLIREKDKRDDFVRQFAQVVRKMHEIEADPESFEPLRTNTLRALPMLEGVVCSKEEVDKLRQIFEIIPDRQTFIHGDCHPGNVMLQGGDMMFIDLSTSGTGHPIFDMMSMCMIYHIRGKDEAARNSTPLMRGLDAEETEHIWQLFLKSYLDTEDEALIAKAQEQIAAFSCARVLFAAIAMPGYLKKEAIEFFKNAALAYVDRGVEPLCF